MTNEIKFFISHTKGDKDYCDDFDTIIEKVTSPDLKKHRFRSELCQEEFENPKWITIIKKIESSSALFLLVGPKLYEMAQLSLDIINRPLSKAEETEIRDKIIHWRHTQNWIAFEIGVACSKRMDVWVICYGARMNFPVPYSNNLFVATKELSNKITSLRFEEILKEYLHGQKFPFQNNLVSSSLRFKGQICSKCKAQFNLRSTLNVKWVYYKCPQCLERIDFPKEILL